MTRKRLLSTVTLLALFALPAATARAGDDTENWGQVGSWKINYDDSVSGCYAIQFYESGMVVRIGIDLSNRRYFLLLGSTKWPTLPINDTPYPVRLQFEDGSYYDGNGRVVGIGTKTMVRINTKSDFFVDFGKHYNLQIFNNSKALVADLSLANTYAAAMEVLNCQEAKGYAPPAPATPNLLPQPQPQATNNQGPWVVALSKTARDTFNVAGKLNGSVPITWLLDTGASITSIPLEIAERMGLKAVDRLKFMLADGSTSTEAIVVIDKLQVGGVVASDVKVAVGGRGTAPLLGKNFLDLFGSYEIDNKAGRLTLRK